MKRSALFVGLFLLVAFAFVTDAAALEENAKRKSKNDYIFNLSALFDGKNLQNGMTIYSDTEGVTDIQNESFDASVSDVWSVTFQSGSEKCTLEKNCIQWDYSEIEGACILFQLTVAEGGCCVPNLSFFSSPESGTYELYLQRAFEIDENLSLENKLNATRRIGVIDAYSTEKCVRTEYFPEQELSSGEYFLIILPVKTERNETSGSLQLRSFSLSENRNVEEIGHILNENSGKLEYNTNYTSFALDLTKDDIKYNLTMVNWKKDAVDLSLTDAYSIDINEIRNRRSSTHGINEYGIFSTIRVNSYDNSLAERSIIPIRIYVPYPGKYQLGVLNNFGEGTTFSNAMDSLTGNMMFTKVYFGSASDVLTPQGIAENINEFHCLGWYDSKVAGVNVINNITIPSPGEYYVLFIADPESLTMNPYINGNEKTDIINVGEYDYQCFAMSGIELTPIVNDEASAVQAAYEEVIYFTDGNDTEEDVNITSGTVRAVASDNFGNPVGGGVAIPETELPVGSGYTAKAPVIPGYKFSYWKTGLGADSKIVSASANYTFNITSGGVMLTAVYTDENGNVAVYYNSNGEILGADENDYILPELPSAVGFGQATHWALYGSDKMFMPGDTGTVNGPMYFVAQCKEAEEKIITVPDYCTVVGNPKYGDTVAVTAPEKKETLFFNYWKDVDGEILSCENSYAFTVMNDVELIPVYAEYKLETTGIRKIVTENVDKQVMVRYIGFENTVERGVLFGENASLDNYVIKKIMTTWCDCYTVTNETGLPTRAYALLSSGKVVYSD